ncbi:asparagine synthetase B, partial [bacterium]|nr:asparagine synthetase B [bacterium]
MCGIFIAIHKTDRPLEEKLPLYGRALSDLSFRGPDWKLEKIIGENIYFGQTILSLTGDVTSSKGEHLISRSKRYHIAFNGEIYNYRELYQNHLNHLSPDQERMTDTEVLINLHDRFNKEKIPQHLDGMYAYAVFDFKDNKLVISRDPQGEKTLFIFENKDFIFISSEMRPIERVFELELDSQVLRDYFCTRHFMFESRTLFRDVRQLCPGQIEELDLGDFNWKSKGRLKLSHFIDPIAYHRNQQRTLDDLTDELDILLEKSVKEMVPTGRKFASVVSGGVDSSLITAYAVKHSNPDILIAVNHLGKGQISHDLQGFEKYFDRPVNVINVDQVVYSRGLINAQEALSAPVFSHSFVGQSLQSQ